MDRAVSTPAAERIRRPLRSTLFASLLLGFGSLASAQQPPMTFFVTSVGNGSNGGNYEGLAGADAQCQALATIAGAGDRTWAAYLSTAPIDGVPGELVNARDRIGSGPWHNFAGELIASDVASLHSNGIAAELMLTENGGTVPASGPENEHDILTGSFADGTAMTEFPGNPAAPPPNCLNWTSPRTISRSSATPMRHCSINRGMPSMSPAATKPACARPPAPDGCTASQHPPAAR